MNELTVNSEGNISHAVNTSETVNSTPKFCFEVNIKLSQQMRKILLFLYEHRDHVWQQVEVISSIYPDEEYLTLSHIASVSRSFKTLIKAGLVTSRDKYYSDNLSSWIVQRVHYFLTEKGEQFVKENLREVEP